MKICTVATALVFISGFALAAEPMPPTKQAEAPADPTSELLAKKEKELARLQAEVEELRHSAGRMDQITLSFCVFQYSRNRLEKAKVHNIDKLLGKRDETTNYQVFEQSGEFGGLLEELQKQSLIKVLARPTVITVNKRKVLFHTGGVVPTVKPSVKHDVSIAYARFGTEIEALPALVGQDTVELQLRLGISEIDGSVPVGENELPQLRRFSIDTAAKMQLGQWWAVGGPTKKVLESQVGADGKLVEFTNEIETVIAVKPTRLEVPKQARKSDARGSDSTTTRR